jgi:hypothetical protein
VDWADHYLSRFRWYRRRRGGRWEWWFIDTPVGSWMWFRNEVGRPGLGRGLPDVEEYP